MIEPMWATPETEQKREEIADISGSHLPSKRQKKGLAATELMKPSGAVKDQSFISQKFSCGSLTKKDELEDRLVGLISVEDRELLALAEKNQYIALKGMSVETKEGGSSSTATQGPAAKGSSTAEQLS